jgi:hypothetical protein
VATQPDQHPLAGGTQRSLGWSATSATPSPAPTLDTRTTRGPGTAPPTSAPTSPEIAAALATLTGEPHPLNTNQSEHNALATIDRVIARL